MSPLHASPGETAPPFTDSILAWLAAAGLDALTIAGIIAGAVVLAWVLRLIIRRVVARIVNGAKSKANVDDTQALERSPVAAMRLVQRTRTLGSILQNITGVVIVTVTVLLCIYVIAPDALGSFALLSAALGAGLGFGAQNIVKDVLNGIFIVAEDQIGIGDVVDLGLASGIVEYVSVRITHVRDANGTLWYVRNGEITRIGNMSQGWSRVIVDVTVPADTPLDDIERALLTAADELAATPKWRTRIIDAPELWGLESLTGETLVVRIVMKSRASARDDVARELRVRLKGALDAAEVAGGSLTTVVLSGIEAAQRVRGANPPVTQPQPVAPRAARGVWRVRKGSDAEGRGPDTGTAHHTTPETDGDEPS